MAEILRSEIDETMKWDLSSVYKDENAWNEDFNLCNEKLENFKNYEKTITNSAKELYNCLAENNLIGELSEKLYVYAHLKLAENSNENLGQRLAGKSKNLQTNVMTITSFVEPTILECDKAKIDEYMHSFEKLKEYEHYLKDLLREKEHILPKEQEELLAGASMLSEAPSDIYNMINNADISFGNIKNENGEDITVTQGKYISLLESKNPKVRKDAFFAVHGAYDNLKNTMASSLYANTNGNVFFAKARKYPDCINMFLSSGNINPSVYTNLINTVHDYLPYLHEYVDMRKKRLGLSDIHIYDLYTPVVTYKPEKINYDTAKDTVIKSLNILGEDYINVLKEGFNNRWVDVYENKGKRSGAFSWGSHGTNPYVLMNYNDTLSEMFTLAHEMGHSLHSYYSWKNQPYQYSSYTIFLAEIASTANECLLHDYLIENTNDESRKAYLYNHHLDQFRGTVFRQTMFAEFELKIHELVENGEPLTVENLNEIYRNLNRTYYGKNIILDDISDIEWARIPHFYSSYYVYQYATGFSAAVSLAKNMKENGQKSVDKYLNFLKQGSSDYSINIMKNAGVDMEKPDYIKNALEVFASTLRDLKE